MLLLSACNGIFEDIYDEPLAEEKNEYGFIFVDSKTNTGRIYIDATDYTEWHYIDLHGNEVTATHRGATTVAPRATDLHNLL